MLSTPWLHLQIYLTAREILHHKKTPRDDDHAASVIAR